MKHYKWKHKPFAVIHPRRGQKYRLGQLCVELHKGRRPSVELLADLFGIAPATIYAAMRAPCPKGRARPAKGNGKRPIGRKPLVDVIKPVTPMSVVEPVGIAADPWAVAENLVHLHGVDTVFDRVILPAIT
jgi:hypothetical protein